jgi:hypothetical protein
LRFSGEADAYDCEKSAKNSRYSQESGTPITPVKTSTVVVEAIRSDSDRPKEPVFNHQQNKRDHQNEIPQRSKDPFILH